MASQDDAEETKALITQPALRAMCMDAPVQDNRRRESDGEPSGAKRPKPEPLRIAQLREDVQMFIRTDAKERNVPGPMYQMKLSESFRCLARENAAGSTVQPPTDLTSSQTPSMPTDPAEKSRDEELLRAIIAESEVVTDVDADKEMTDTGKEGAELEATAPMAHRDDKAETLSESFRCLATENAAGSTMPNPTDAPPSQTPSMPGDLADKSRDDDLLRAIIAESEMVTDADADIEMADTGKESAELEATAPIEHRDDKVETADNLPANRDNACKDTASPGCCTPSRGATSLPSGDESCDTEVTGEDEAFPHSFSQPPDGVPEAETELDDEKVYALLLELHNKFELMGRGVGDRGGPSIRCVRCALQALPATVRDLGEMPNIKKDLAERHRLGKHQMRELLRRIEFFFVLVENLYKDKLAKTIQ